LQEPVKLGADKAQREKFRLRGKAREILTDHLDRTLGHSCFFCTVTENLEVHRRDPTQDYSTDNTVWACRKHNLDQRIYILKDGGQLDKEREEKDPWREPAGETEAEIRRTLWPVFKKRCLSRALGIDKADGSKDRTKLLWIEAQFTIGPDVGIASNTANNWIKEITQPYNRKGPLRLTFIYPPKGPRVRVLELAEGWTEAKP